ncbi:Predicted PurR-regulated permease PerM [Pedococcus dokdonensis]|uniref:Predicted PurR-regulated permease PerM n=1 Tax=Pedococcus dokdonensis TaxID=443156 RepID=A0A1H0LI01_9MICO|nr:AI-2E family transporter [Pedococcus dokdonensis]SDO67782.1 Predicted PurR-regulated permease PerM [Pedococcus dokdonensis]
MSVLDRWREFRRTQRDALDASNHPHQQREHSSELGELLSDLLPSRRTAGDGDGDEPGEQAGEALATNPGSEGHRPDDGPDRVGSGSDSSDDGRRYGRAGRPLNRQSPFYVGFVGAIGVLAALLLWNTLGRLTTVLTLVVVAFFLALTLNPLVEFLTRQGLRRGGAVALVFAGVVAVFTLLGLVVVPPVISQGTDLAQKAPDYLDQILGSRFVKDLDQHYDVVDKIQAEFTKRISDGSFVGQVFGGVLGVGAAVIGGIFQAFTVLVLTLFLLASLPRVKQAAYAMVPASRRPRVESLSEEIMRRTGSYAIGQVAVATINAICSWIMMMIVGIPYAAVLAVAVGFLGLIPMVGATIGAALVCLVAIFDEPKKAIIALIYYVIYQQLENYVVAPRIMQRTVSVPGAVTVVAALAGGTLLGVLGALLAIPVAAGLLLLYEEVLIPRQRRH